MTTPFLGDLQRRPLNIADARNAKPAGLFLGHGPNALEVVVLEAGAQPAVVTLRAIWKSRLAGRATPLLVVVLHGKSAALCGPNGDPPPAFPSLDTERVERICRAALAGPDRNAALRFLSSVIPEADAADVLRKSPPKGLDQVAIDTFASTLETPWGARIENKIREPLGHETGPAAANRVISAINDLRLKPYEAPEPLPPIQIEEVSLICWMAVSTDAKLAEFSANPSPGSLAPA